MLHVLTLRGKDRKRAVIDWCEIRDGQPYRLFQALLPRLVAANTAVSGAVQRHVAARSGGPALLLPSGVNRQAYYAAEPAHRSGVLYLGRLSPHKGVPLLIESFTALRKAGMTERLTIAGAGPALAEVAAAKAASAFADDIHLLGEVSEEHKRALLARNRVLVLPSRREGFPRVVAEAMASALPVVTTRFPQNGTAMVAAPAYVGLAALGPLAIALTFGARWGSMATMVPSLCAVLAGWLALHIVCVSLRARGLGRIAVWVSTPATLLDVALLACFMPFGLSYALAAWAARSVLWLPVAGLLLHRYLGVDLQRLARRCVAPAIAAAAMGIVMLALQKPALLGVGVPALVVTIPVASLLYLVLLTTLMASVLGHKAVTREVLSVLGRVK